MAKEFTGHAARLETLRKARGLKKRDLATLLDVSPVAFQGWLDRGITEKALTRIADALNVRREWFDEDTPVERAQKETNQKPDALLIVQRFLALPDDERDKLIEIVLKLLAPREN